ncbi:DUF3114 domain-containing protein [Latilactobacillus sakei]
MMVNQKLRRLMNLQTVLITQLQDRQTTAVMRQMIQQQLLPQVRGQLLLALQDKRLFQLPTATQTKPEQLLIQNLIEPSNGAALSALWLEKTQLRYHLPTKNGLVAHFAQLELENWDDNSLRAYAAIIRQQEPLFNLTAANRALHRVGSPLYQQLYQAYGGRTTNRLVNWQRANLVLMQLGAQLDAHHFLQLGAEDFEIYSEMPPDAPFLKTFAQSVQLAFKDQDLTDQRLHQFRMYLDRQNIQYIRTHFKTAGDSDEMALQKFVAQRQKKQRAYWLKREPARLHNKYMRGVTFNADANLNRKRLTPDFHSEFIIDRTGQFVTQWDVLRYRTPHQIESDPAQYVLNIAEKNALLNGESFNYANRNNLQHAQLDSRPPRQLDHQLRDRAFAGWQSPNKQQYRQSAEKSDAYSRPY